MVEKNDNRRSWDWYSKLYDWEVLRFSGKAYQEMYDSMEKILAKDMKVLEVATGTGLIAHNIASFVKEIYAIDFAPKMIEVAKKKGTVSNLKFSVEDATNLSYPNESFDAVIISNALHIMPNPELVLENIKRVLKPSGILIAPTFSHGHLDDKSWNFGAFLLKLIGFQTYAKWTYEQYLTFISNNGFRVTNSKVLDAAFPLIYLEAKKEN